MAQFDAWIAPLYHATRPAKANSATRSPSAPPPAPSHLPNSAAHQPPSLRRFSLPFVPPCLVPNSCPIFPANVFTSRVSTHQRPALDHQQGGDHADPRARSFLTAQHPRSIPIPISPHASPKSRALRRTNPVQTHRRNCNSTGQRRLRFWHTVPFYRTKPPFALGTMSPPRPPHAAPFRSCRATSQNGSCCTRPGSACVLTIPL